MRARISTRPPYVDAALGLALLAIAESEVWIGWRDGGDGVSGGSRPVEALVLAVPALALAWRRSAATAATVAIGAAIVAQVGLVAPYAPFLPLLLPLAIGNYSNAAYGSRSRRLVGLAATVVGAAAVAVAIPVARSSGEILFSAFVVAGTWFVGDLVRQRQRRIEHVESSRDEWTRAAVAGERAAIARELHDLVAHSVSVMGVQAGAARMLLDEDTDRARAALHAIEQTARQSVAELQRLLALLRDDESADLAPQPGVEDLPALLESFRAAGVNVRLETEAVPADLPPGTGLAAYRIVQEALTNVLKHARARRADVRVVFRGDALELEVADDGAGPQRDGARGHGLIGMRERAALYEGTFEAEGRSGRGFVVRARLPLQRGPKT